MSEIKLCDLIWHVISRCRVGIFSYGLLHPLYLLTYVNGFVKARQIWLRYEVSDTSQVHVMELLPLSRLITSLGCALWGCSASSPVDSVVVLVDGSVCSFLWSRCECDANHILFENPLENWMRRRGWPPTTWTCNSIGDWILFVMRLPEVSKAAENCALWRTVHRHLANDVSSLGMLIVDWRCEVLNSVEWC